MKAILHQTAGGRFDLELDDGEVIEDIVNESEAPLNEPLLIKLEDGRLVAWDHA